MMQSQGVERLPLFTNYQRIMNTNDLKLMRQHCIDLLVASLMNFVLEHGEEMSDYFRDEHGINDDNVVKVLDLASEGCHFSVPIKYRAESEEDYEHHAFWTLYVVNSDYDGMDLKYYQFYNSGLDFDNEESEPDHDYARCLSLSELEFIYSYVIDNYQKSQES